MRNLSSEQIKNLPDRMAAADFIRATTGKSQLSAKTAPEDGASTSKYKNKGIRTEEGFFHSIGESERWTELKLLAAAGTITDLKRQVKITLEVDGIWIADYFADFTYTEAGEYIVEDFKGKENSYFRLKKRLIFAVKKIDIRLTRKLKKKDARLEALAPAIAAADKKAKAARKGKSAG